MREVIDRLREAETALDRQLSDLYFTEHSAARTRALTLLLAAKANVWFAQMQALDAHAGSSPADPT